MARDRTTATDASAGIDRTEDPRFRRMLWAKLCVDAAEYALSYALLIAIVRRTGSSIHSTLLVSAFTLPAILFGIPAGAIADRLPIRPVLLTALIVRVALTVALYRVIADLWRTYTVIFLFAAVGQVFGPLWVAMLPRLVALPRLSHANALLNLAQLGGQIGGVVILAPLFLKTLGDRSVFILVAVFLIAAAVLTARMGAIEAPSSRQVVRALATPRAARAGLRAGWDAIVGDRAVYRAVVQITVITCLLKSLLVLFPYYTREVLGIAPENTVYVAAPAAIGAAAGLALAPAIAFVGRGRLATAGFAISVAALVGLALVTSLRPFVSDHLHLGMTGLARAAGVPPVVTTAMLLAIPLGLGVSLNLVAARTVMNERVPGGVQARVFATQGVLANVASLVPLFLIGALTALIGARPAMLLAAVAAAGTPTWLAHRHHAAMDRPCAAEIDRTRALPPSDR